MPFVPANGTRIYYEEAGSPEGRPLLLLHAALQTGESMEPLRKRPELQGFRMVAPDQRGHGQTANPGRTLSIPQLANDMEALMAHLGLDRPIVAGYSLGGSVGLELARRGRVSGLVVLASRIHTALRGRSAFDPADIRRRSPQWAEQLARKHAETAWEELAVELGLLFETWPGFSPEDLRSIACPVLVTMGDKDHMVPVEQGQELAAAVPNGRFHLAPRAGHPDLLYRQDAVAAVVEFITSLP
jgi:pimeloyl-ACP methyl ester carboxylesterase